MNKSYIYILLALLVACIAGCNKMEDDLQEWEVIGKNTVSLYCNLENNTSSHLISGKLGTKALVDQTTSVDSLLCNFLSIDEQANGEFSDDEYVTGWDDALVSEGSIATIPDNSVGNKNLRSISLCPEKAYHSEGNNLKSRMIGWYPKNIVLPLDSNLEETDVSFKSFDTIYELINDKHCVKFTGLDGSVDLMVSDVRDGSLLKKFGSDNFFQFKHYLSAVRIHAKAEESAQDIGAWGYIENVIIMNQPTSCVVALPSAPSETAQDRVFGDVVSWGDYKKHPIVTTAIYGNKDQSEGNITAQKYPIKLDGTGVKKYLGYSLIKPNDKLWVQVHTRSGIYDVEIAPQYKQNGQSGEVDIFKAGYIYDLHLNFNTDGTIYAFIGIDGSDRYYDLTTGLAFDDNAGGSGYEYKWANCYVVKSELSEYGVGTPYTGFCFDATVVGNGEDGQMSIGAQSLYPANVHISPSTADLVWESSPGLVSQIELVFGYVRFKVAKKDASHYREGNAVIAVSDQNGKVMWSWHIWITDTPQNFSYTEGEGESKTTITMLDRNLGATAASWTGANDALETYGLYYQWGRKDPSMGPPTWNYSPINMITAPYYDYSSEEKDAAEVVRFATPTLKDAVENPMYLIMPTAQTQSYYFNWLYEKIDFLWGYNKDEGTNVDKTIYDPCPYGYKVSGGELTDLFSFSGKTISYENYGQIVTLTGDNPKKIYFPYTGYKGVDKGLNSLVCSWKYVGQKADYQSSVINTTVEHAEYMHRTRVYLSRETEWNELNVGTYRGRQIMDHTNRKTAAPVRCVKDEYHNRVIAFITPDKNTISTYTDKVTLQLYAKSFKQPISSATLTIGYHMKEWNNGTWTEGEHQEKTITLGNWTKSSNDKVWEQNFEFDFATLFNENGTNGKINFNETTGSFRFMLNVRTADNINKMASASITLGKNYVEFVDWDAQPVVLPKQQINRTIKIYGDQIPVNVLMFKDYEQEGIDITANLKQSSTSDYKYSYTCTTDGFLTFNTSEDHKVKFKITFENNGILETEEKTISVCQLEIINTSTFSQEEYYIIENADFEDSYVYDNGFYMKTKTAPDYSTLFKIIPVQNAVTYKIQNVSSQNYVSVGANNNTATMYIYTNDTNATKFTLVCTDGTFTITGNVTSGDYNWNLPDIDADINGLRNINGNNNHIKWKIYKVTLPTNNQ